MPKSFTPEEVEVAKLRLAFLKENAYFAKFYKKLAKDPYELCPELRESKEDFDKYRHKIHILEINGTSFFGGYAQKFGINDKFLYELQSLPTVEELPLVLTEDILILLNPETDFDKVSCPGLIEMLPLMFRTPGVIEYGRAHGLVSNSEGELTYRRYRPSIDINLMPYERLLKIDLRKKKEQIITEFKDFIDTEILKQGQGLKLGLETAFEWSPDITRNRIKERWKQLGVWKMRKDVKNFSEIAFKTKVSEDTAKKQFYRAFELITGGKYNKDTWRTLVCEKLEQRIRSRPSDVDGKTYKKFLDLKDVKQQHQTFTKAVKKKDSNNKELDFLNCYRSQNNNYEYNMFLLVEDIKKMCKKCPDRNCYEALISNLNKNDLDSWKPDCPRLYKFLKF